MTVAPFSVLATSFFSTHHASAADLLAGTERAPVSPTYPLLVARARRFTSLVTQLHMEVCGALADKISEPPASVFGTCHGEIQTAETMIAGIRDGKVSSARFALSVHNSASGLYSVATGNTAPSTTVTGKNAVAAAWLEAVLTVHETGRSVLLSIADEPVPALFQCPTHPFGLAAAFLLGPGRGATLSTVPGDAAIDPAQALARAAAGQGGPLGAIQPGALLELSLS